MPQQPDQECLEEVNEDLRRALKLCHSLVDDYRLKLAANSNEAANDGDEVDLA